MRPKGERIELETIDDVRTAESAILLIRNLDEDEKKEKRRIEVPKTLAVHLAANQLSAPIVLGHNYTADTIRGLRAQAKGERIEGHIVYGEEAIKAQRWLGRLGIEYEAEKTLDIEAALSVLALQAPGEEGEITIRRAHKVPA